MAQPQLSFENTLYSIWLNGKTKVTPRLGVSVFSCVLATCGRGGEFTQPRFYLLAEYCIKIAADFEMAVATPVQPADIG